MKFDYIIGNPPYQDDIKGDTKTAKPIYNQFIEETQKLGDVVELIHPARFLFNAGGTPKAWNKKMLNDEHFKILDYQSDSTSFFPSVNVEGGIAISYWDKDQKFEPIKVFSAYPELNSICQKVESLETGSLSETITNRGIYRYSDLAYENPEVSAQSSDRRIAPSAFARMPGLFSPEKPEDDLEYLKIIGLVKGKRVYRWFRRDYVEDNKNIDKFKVLVPKANGSPQLGKAPSNIIGTPLLAEPQTGFTETFISVGESESEDEAKAVLKYLKTKFARTMLGVLKVTQNNAKPTWAKVPLQDFTSDSDIDWSKPISEIDQQLYNKYSLNKDEIEFIETHVKDM